jgi:hypothetical protein
LQEGSKAAVLSLHTPLLSSPVLLALDDHNDRGTYFSSSVLLPTFSSSSKPLPTYSLSSPANLLVRPSSARRPWRQTRVLINIHIHTYTRAEGKGTSSLLSAEKTAPCRVAAPLSSRPGRLLLHMLLCRLPIFSPQVSPLTHLGTRCWFKPLTIVRSNDSPSELSDMSFSDSIACSSHALHTSYLCPLLVATPLPLLPRQLP